MKLNTISKLGLAARVRVKRNRGSRWLIAVGLAICCASIALVVRAYNPSSPESRAATSPVVARLAPPLPPKSGAGSQFRPREAVTTVRFNLFDLGIYPREIHVRKGLLAVTIEDFSGGSTGVVIERETGSAPEQVGSVQRERASSGRGKSEIRFGPGRYHVYMADRPANRALLVVEP